jgi:hypothetical protein
VNTALKHAGRVLAGILPAAVLARLGVPALAAAVSLAVLILGVTCWVINNGDRSDRVTRMIYARHGDARCLPPDTGPPVPASQPHPRRSARRR